MLLRIGILDEVDLETSCMSRIKIAAQTKYDVAMLPQVSNYVQLIEQVYREYAPEHHAAQLAAISEVRSEWQLFPESSISSVTSYS